MLKSLYYLEHKIVALYEEESESIKHIYTEEIVSFFKNRNFSYTEMTTILDSELVRLEKNHYISDIDKLENLIKVSMLYR